MSTLPVPRDDRAPAPPVPVRHGKCRLEVTISGSRYTLRRCKPLYRGSKVWSLKQIEGPRVGTIRVVVRHQCVIMLLC